MWEEVLICILVYAGIFFILPDSIRKPLISKRYLLQTVVFCLALVYLSAYALHSLTRPVEKFLTSGACGNITCASACMFNADISTTGALTNIVYATGYDACLMNGMDISGAHVSGAVKLKSLVNGVGQLDTALSYTSKSNNSFTGSTIPVCYVNTKMLETTDIKQQVGFNLYGRYVRIYAPKDEIICSFTATLSASGALTNIEIASGQLLQGAYILNLPAVYDNTVIYRVDDKVVKDGIVYRMREGTGAAGYAPPSASWVIVPKTDFSANTMGAVLTSYTPGTGTTLGRGQLDRNITYTAGSVRLTAKFSNGYFALSQVMVYNAKGENIARGSGVSTDGTKSTYQSAGSAASVIDGSAITRSAPDGTNSSRAWGNANVLGRDLDYWEVDLGSRNMIVNVVVVGATDFGDTANITRGGGNKIKGVRVAVLENSTDTTSTDGICMATPIIIYPTPTTGSQITDDEKKIIGPYILKGMDGDTVLQIYRLLDVTNPVINISDLTPRYYTGDQVASIYKSIEDNNITFLNKNGILTGADYNSRKQIVRAVKAIEDIPQTTAGTVNDFKDAMSTYMRNNTKSYNGRFQTSSQGSEDVVQRMTPDRGIPATLSALVAPLTPKGQSGSMLSYSSNAVTGGNVDGTAYDDVSELPDLAAGIAPVAGATSPQATTDADGNTRIPQSGALSNLDAYLALAGYQAPNGSLSKALPQWYLVKGSFTYSEAVIKCLENGDNLATLAQLTGAQTAGAGVSDSGWVKNISDRIYSLQADTDSYDMIQVPTGNSPAGSCAYQSIGGQCYYPCAPGEIASGTRCTNPNIATTKGTVVPSRPSGNTCRPIIDLKAYYNAYPDVALALGGRIAPYDDDKVYKVNDKVSHNNKYFNMVDAVGVSGYQPERSPVWQEVADATINAQMAAAPSNWAAIRNHANTVGAADRRNIPTMLECSGLVGAAHCYGIKTSSWPTATDFVAPWTNKNISIPDGQVVPMPSASSTPNQAPGEKIDISNVYSANDWNKRTKNDPFKNKDVFHVSSRYIYTKRQAQAVCELAGGDLATYEQLQRAFEGGAQWCHAGWVKDRDVAYYPMQDTNVPGCNGASVPTLVQSTPPSGLAGANCYGIKPTRLENLFSLSDSGIITANKKGRYVRIFNTPNLADRKEAYINLTQVFIKDTSDNIISYGATAIAENPPTNPASWDSGDSGTDAGAQRLLQYQTVVNPKNYDQGYHSKSWSDNQFIEIDLGQAFADRKGTIGTIQIVPRNLYGFGQTNDRVTGLRVVISNTPSIWPFSNRDGSYAWTQTELNLADSCGLSSDGLMKYKKTCDLGGGRKMNVCVTDTTIGCDQICVDGKTLQGKDCASSGGVPKSQYGAECDISFDFQMYQIGYLYSGKGSPTTDSPSSANPYHSRDMNTVTVSVLDKCSDKDQSKGAWFPGKVFSSCNKDVWYAPCPAGYDDWNGVLHVCCTCYQAPRSWTGPDTYLRTCTGGDPVIHTGTWYGPDTYARTYWGISVTGGDPVIHTGTWYGPDKYRVTCAGGDPVVHTAGGDTIAKISDPPRIDDKLWRNKQFTDPIRWAQAQQDVEPAMTRYFGGIQRASLTINGRCEAVKRKYTAIESMGINYLRAYAQEMSAHNNSLGGEAYITLMKSYVNSADIKGCDKMRETLKDMFGVETGIDSQPCSEGGPMLFWKTAGDVNGPGGCELADGLAGWTASVRSPSKTGRTLMNHILKHAIIAAPAPYAYKYTNQYKADIAKLQSGQEWIADATVIPMNSESPAKPNFNLLSFDARCCTTRNGVYEVMSHIGAAVWAGQNVTPYFGGCFSSAEDVIEGCMRQGDNPIGGIWYLNRVVAGGTNRDQTRTFSTPVVGRYVRVRPPYTTVSHIVLQFKQIIVKDPSGNRIPAARVYATSTNSTMVAANAYDNISNSLYHGAKSGMDSYYNEFWEVDLGGNKTIGSITYVGRTDCCPDALNPDRIGGTRITVWPSKIGWDIPINPFTTQDQNSYEGGRPGNNIISGKYPIDRIVAAKVLDGTVKNYRQCLDNAEINQSAQAAHLPDDNISALQTLNRICSPYFTNARYINGDTSDDRKGDYKLNMAASNR